VTRKKEEKTIKMVEWWTKANKALADENVNISLFPKMVEVATVAFRDHTRDMFKECEANNVPLLVFSAGLTPVIESVFMHLEKKIYKNMHIVSNNLGVTDTGKITGLSGTLIHVLNKNEFTLPTDTPWYGQIKNRDNVILMGDHTGDASMADKLPHGEIIRIGFLNSKVEENIENYKKLFDVVVTNDGTMEFALKLIKEILHNKDFL